MSSCFFPGQLIVERTERGAAPYSLSVAVSSRSHTTSAGRELSCVLATIVYDCSARICPTNLQDTKLVPGTDEVIQ